MFGTEVMVKVATGVKGPIKFVFPKALPAPAEMTREAFSMLGLGDVVVPGFFIAFLLSFDAYNARKEGMDTTASAQWAQAVLPHGLRDVRAVAGGDGGGDAVLQARAGGEGDGG